MGITMQGSWTLRVKARNAAYAQRFKISGADIGNGTYDGIVGTTVFVSGAHWIVTVQHRVTRRPWADSAQRMGLPRVDAGLLRFDMGANDGGLDNDYDDLVLACSLPASESDYVLYGAVQTYTGNCVFNPRRDDYIVIDSPVDVDALCARYPRLKQVIGKLYPERLEASPGRDADPTPLLIPSGLPNVAVGLLFQSRSERVNSSGDTEDDLVEALQTKVMRVPFKATALKAGVGRLSQAELTTIAGIRDSAVRSRYQGQQAPGLTLRFQQYHRNEAERIGDPYTGTGLREDLGMAVTDEQGNYIFRFRREARASAPCGAAPATRRPHAIVQVAHPGQKVSFETAPYDNVANLRRIDLCVPAAVREQLTPGSVMTWRLDHEPARATLAVQESSVFEYVGSTALLVVGPVTGRCYRFGRPGATLAVDRRDRSSLTSIASLRMQLVA